MCTCITLTTRNNHHLVGRNMDLETNFNQSPLFVPKDHTIDNVVEGNNYTNKYKILGMGTLVEGHPLFAEAFNDKGLVCAGLNFPGYAYYDEEKDSTKLSLGPYDLILYLVSQCETISQVKDALGKIALVGQPFRPYLPLSTLHWIVIDKTGESIVIEKTKEKVSVYDNKIGVLTNSPTFDWHITHLNHYIGLQSTQPEATTWDKQPLKPLGQGVGLYGIPGDSTPASRFLRAAYLKSHSAFLEDEVEGIGQCFHILNNVAMVGGSVVTPEGKNDITLYSSCIDQDTATYYYKTYKNHQINQINLNDLGHDTVTPLAYRDHPSIHMQLN